MQNVQDKPWTNEELKKLEEALPMLTECDLEMTSRLYKAKTGVGCDGVHPKVSPGLDKRNKVESGAATSLHDDVLLDTEECYK